MSYPSEQDLADIRAFIDSVEWRFAKTMPLCPHFYNVVHWNPTKRNGFFKLVSAIFNHGYQEVWPRPTDSEQLRHVRKRVVTYFNVDGYRYWAADPAIEDTDLINRARLE